MFINEKKWETLRVLVNQLYSNLDYYSDDMKDLVENIDNSISDIELSNNDKIYVITNNAVVSGEIDYSIYGVTTDKKEAKRLFDQAIRDAKCDGAFDEVDPINVDEIDSLSNIGEEWCYSETENSFELFQNGYYNSNNFSIELKEYEISKQLEKDSEVSL